VTGPSGTRRLAIALRDAVNNAPVEVKEEIVAAVTLARGLAGKSVSVDSFAEHFHLSPHAREVIASGLKTGRATQEIFTFDINEFRNFIAYKSIELDNGALLTAGTDKFEEVFHKTRLYDEGRVEYSTQGKVVNEKLRKQR
jgi:pyoverdine/dityrosine biosynthesis protein Dit1